MNGFWDFFTWKWLFQEEKSIFHALAKYVQTKKNLLQYWKLIFEFILQGNTLIVISQRKELFLLLSPFFKFQRTSFILFICIYIHTIPLNILLVSSTLKIHFNFYYHYQNKTFFLKIYHHLVWNEPKILHKKHSFCYCKIWFCLS